MSLFSDMFGPAEPAKSKDSITIHDLIKRKKSMAVVGGKLYMFTVEEVDAVKMAKEWGMEDPKK